jgi:hypothetical protein
VIDLKNLGLPDHIFRYFRVSFHDLLCKNLAAAVSHQAVTLRMMSNNRTSAPVINDHLRIEKAKNGGNHPASTVTINFFIWGVTYLLKNRSYMYKTNG